MMDTNCFDASIAPWCSNDECYEAFLCSNVTVPGGTI
jgi:hypothetical protein